MTSKRLVPALAALVLFAACGSDDDASGSATDAPATAEVPAETDAAADAPPATEAAPSETDAAAEPVTGPATIAADDQVGDGSTVTVASVSLPAPGFVVVHADGGGSPGAILGWSDTIPAGDSADVVVSLQEPLVESATVYPMAHVDANANGEYEFFPPDVVTDAPATTSDGGVAVVAIAYEVAGASGEEAGGDGIVLALSSTDLGDIIVDGDGNTLYLFTPDAQGDSVCYDDCETNWPIVGEITSVVDGPDEALLGATTRTNGDVQATYNGWPLYYFAGDAAPGDTNGQGVGDVWWVLDAAGEAIGL